MNATPNLSEPTGSESLIRLLALPRQRCGMKNYTFQRHIHICIMVSLRSLWCSLTFRMKGSHVSFVIFENVNKKLNSGSRCHFRSHGACVGVLRGGGE